jgi:hypothetical protein
MSDSTSLDSIVRPAEDIESLEVSNLRNHSVGLSGRVVLRAKEQKRNIEDIPGLLKGARYMEAQGDVELFIKYKDIDLKETIVEEPLKIVESEDLKVLEKTGLDNGLVDAEEIPKAPDLGVKEDLIETVKSEQAKSEVVKATKPASTSKAAKAKE